MERVSEQVKVEMALNEADIKTLKKSPFYDMQDFRNIYAKVQTGSLEVGKKVTLMLLQANNKNGTGAKVLGEPLEVVAQNAGAHELELEILANQMDTNNDFRYVGFSVKSDNGAVLSAFGVVVLGNKRYR